MNASILRLLGTILLGIFASHPVLAQPQTGDAEISFSGFLTSTEGVTVAFGDLRLGFFASSNLLVSIGGGVSGTSTDYEDNISFSGSGGLQYNFSASGNTMYFKAQAYIPDLEEAGDLLYGQGLIGYRSYISDSVAIDTEAGFGSLLTGDGDDSGMFIAKVGFTVFF